MRSAGRLVSGSRLGDRMSLRLSHGDRPKCVVGRFDRFVAINPFGYLKSTSLRWTVPPEGMCDWWGKL